MDPRAIKLAGSEVRFAMGLSWRHESARPKRARLKALAAEKGRWGLVRKAGEGAFQVGFCNPIEGVKKAGKLKSLADVIAESNVAPWRGRFEIGIGEYWYIAVGAGHEILPAGDSVCSADELNEQWDKHKAHAAWTAEITGTADDLARLIEGKRGQGSLVDFAPSFSSVVNVKGKFTKVVFAVATLALLGGGSVWYLQHQKEQEREAQRVAEAQRKAREALTAAPVIVKKVTPWTDAPNAQVVFAACHEAWSNQALVSDGWLLELWSCLVKADGLEVQTKWARDTGRANSAPGVLDPSGDHSLAVRRVLIDWKGGVGSVDGGELVVFTEAKRQSWDLAQKFGMVMQIDAGEKDAPKVPGSAADVGDHPEWEVHRFGWALPFAPWMGFDKSFDRVPGLRVQGIKAEIAGDGWTLNAGVYAKPDPKIEEGK